MPRSVVEIISGHSKKKVIQGPAVSSFTENKTIIRERARLEQYKEFEENMQLTKEVAERVFRESGIIEELENIKFLYGKFPRVALFTHVEPFSAQLVLAWGNSFKVYADRWGSFIDRDTILGIPIGTVDGQYMDVYMDRQGQPNLRIQNEFRSQNDWMANRDRMNEMLASAFLQPFSLRRWTFPKVRFGFRDPFEPPPPSSDEGPAPGSVGPSSHP